MIDSYKEQVIKLENTILVSQYIAEARKVRVLASADNTGSFKVNAGGQMSEEYRRAFEEALVNLYGDRRGVLYHRDVQDPKSGYIAVGGKSLAAFMRDRNTTVPDSVISKFNVVIDPEKRLSLDCLKFGAFETWGMSRAVEYGAKNRVHAALGLYTAVKTAVRSAIHA